MGKFVKGHKGGGNRFGVNQHRTRGGWQPFPKRVKVHFSYMTAGEIIALADTSKLSSIDTIIVKHLAEALTPGPGRLYAAERFFDRMDGKPK